MQMVHHRVFPSSTPAFSLLREDWVRTYALVCTDEEWWAFVGSMIPLDHQQRNEWLNECIYRHWFF